jgi:hypothetical protein
MSDNFTEQEVSKCKTLSWEEAVLWLKAQPDQNDLIKACFYDDPLQSAAERYYQSTEWLALRKVLPQVGRVLDIGSGRGISAYAFAKDGWRVDALEPNGSGESNYLMMMKPLMWCMAGRCYITRTIWISYAGRPRVF